MPDPHDELLSLGPCATCGSLEQHFESYIPFGRTHEVWRVVCVCGLASMRWSATQIAAAGMWNRHMAAYTPKRKNRYNHKDEVYNGRSNEAC